MDDLSNFALDKPWSPVSYFEEEEEVLEAEGCSHYSFSPTHLASLFESNIKAVEYDLEKSKNLMQQYSNDSEDKQDESNDDDLSHYTLDTESGIKVLDTTYSINRKAIFHDFDRLKKLKASVYEEDKKVLLGDKIDESVLYAYQILPERSSLKELKIEDTHSNESLNDFTNAKQKLMDLEIRLNENNFEMLPNFLNSSTSSAPNVLQSTNHDISNELLKLPDIPPDLPHNKISNSNLPYKTHAQELCSEIINEATVESDIHLLVEKAEKITASFEIEETMKNSQSNTLYEPQYCSEANSNHRVSFDVDEELDELLDGMEIEMNSTNTESYSIIHQVELVGNTNLVNILQCTESSSCKPVNKQDSNVIENFKLINEEVSYVEEIDINKTSCIIKDLDPNNLDAQAMKDSNLSQEVEYLNTCSLPENTPVMPCIYKLCSNSEMIDPINDSAVATKEETLIRSNSTSSSSQIDESVSLLQCSSNSEFITGSISIEHNVKTNESTSSAFEESNNLSLAMNDCVNDNENLSTGLSPEPENEYIPLHNNIIEETPRVLSSQQEVSSSSSSLDLNENERVTFSSNSNQIRHVRFTLDDQQAAREAEQSQPLQNHDIFVESSGTMNHIIQPAGSLGFFAPTWIPDTDTKTCMSCDTKFNVVKRRHHCRACGKVLCAACCNMKFNLPYLENKPARVCQTCFVIMDSVGSESTADNSSLRQPNFTATSTIQALPEAPPPYSESIGSIRSERLGSNVSDAPPYVEAGSTLETYNELSTSSLSTAVLNSHEVGVSSVLNASSININGIPSFSTLSNLPAYTPSNRIRSPRSRTESEMSAVIMFNSASTNLPPILRRENEETRIVNNPDLSALFGQMHDPSGDPVPFIVNKNLVVKVKVVNMDCCTERRCWCFASDGMGASNQEEIVILITVGSSDLTDALLIKKVLQQMNFIFEKAKQGHPVSDLEQLEFDSNISISLKSSGMLFFKSSLQCQKHLLIPTSPYLFGLYITSSEIPWAKNFPLRLLLRIGAEFKYYPCPLFNTLDRESVYNGIGDTIVKLLADFRNFQYTIPRVTGVTINLRGKDTILKLPQYRNEEIIKALNSAEDSVLTLAGNFSSTCDGHLVSVEKDGRYKTQTLSIVLKENRKVTCATFLVVSAALKDSTDGIKAKASIVEDGVMIQVTGDVMKDLKAALKDMKEYQIKTGDPSDANNSSLFSVEWCANESSDRPRLLSPIDGTSFENLTNMKIRHSYDYTSSNLTAKIHWVEVYFLPQDSDTVQRLSARELGQMTSSIAKACMSALSPHLMLLVGVGMTRIGLRINLAADYVEYQIGASLTTLPAELLPTLDDKLVPAIHSVMTNAQERVAVELIFQIVQIV